MLGVVTVLKKLKKRWLLGFVIVVAVGSGYYYFFGRDTSETSIATYAVVETVSLGTVSSGIETTGTIKAAQKLDLDVYKQARRIEAVNVSNASHVEAGTTLFSFDKSGAYVEVESARVGITEAELALANEKANYRDVNTTLRSLENTVATLRAGIVQAEKDLIQARRDFFNADLGVESANDATADKNRPTITGVYNGTTEGTYRIDLRVWIFIPSVWLGNGSREYFYGHCYSFRDTRSQNCFFDRRKTWRYMDYQGP
jgi:multidrug efflux pump subunit AcrA (membrane-fusion protein)